MARHPRFLQYNATHYGLTIQDMAVLGVSGLILRTSGVYGVSIFVIPLAIVLTVKAINYRKMKGWILLKISKPKKMRWLHYVSKIRSKYSSDV